MSLLGEDDTSSLSQTELNWRLFDAIYYKDVDSIYRYIFAGAEITYANEVGNQCIHAAAHTGVPKIVQIILNAGGDVHAKGREDNTPLHFAVAINSIPVVKLLLEKGADPRAVNKKGKSPRDICSIDNTREEILELLESWVIKRCAFLFSPKLDQASKITSRSSISGVVPGGKRALFANATFATMSDTHGSNLKDERKISAAKAQPLIAAVQPLIADAKKLGLGKHTSDIRSSGVSKTLFQPRIKSGMNGTKSSFSDNVDRAGKPEEKEPERLGKSSSFPFQKDGHSDSETPVSANSPSPNSNPVTDTANEKDKVPKSSSADDVSGFRDRTQAIEPKGKGFYVEIDGKEIFVPEDYSDEEDGDAVDSENSDRGSENGNDQGFEKSLAAKFSHSSFEKMESENEDSNSEPAWNKEVIVDFKTLDGSLGIQLQEDGKYTKVSDMNPHGNAAAAGVQIGDVLVQINEASMEGLLLASVMSILSEQKEKAGVLSLKLKRAK